MNIVSKLGLSLLLASMLVGCSEMRSFVKQEIPVIHPATPAPIETKPVDFQVWNQKKVQEIANDPANKDKIWYVLDSLGVKNLNDNLLESVRFVKQQSSIIDYYKHLVDDFNKSAPKTQPKATIPTKKEKTGF